MTVFIIITTSLIYGDSKYHQDYDTRKNEYINGISVLLKKCKGKPYKLIIVENNSLLNERSFMFNIHKTFLQDFGIPVFYTRNNMYKIRNYGTKELIDIKHVIEKVGILDSDFIVKITGRYILDEICPFFDILDNLQKTPYSAIVRYGSYTNYETERPKDNCVTGLIGLKCSYVKELYLPNEDVFIEHVWAEKISSLPDDQVCILDRLGIYIRPSHLLTYILI